MVRRILCIVILLVGCKPAANNTALSSGDANPPSLVAYWQAPCRYYPGQGGAYKRFDVEFGEDASHIIYELTYSDPDCEHEAGTHETVATYRVGDSLGGGLWEIDFRSAVLDQASFQIFQIEEDRLFFGQISAEFASDSPDTRPQTINRGHHHARR